MEINDLEIDLQDHAGNNDNKALKMVPLSDKEMSTVIGGMLMLPAGGGGSTVIGGGLPTPTSTGPAAPPAVPRRR